MYRTYKKINAREAKDTPTPFQELGIENRLAL
jgi:hypothetical protein